MSLSLRPLQAAAIFAAVFIISHQAVMAQTDFLSPGPAGRPAAPGSPSLTGPTAPRTELYEDVTIRNAAAENTVAAYLMRPHLLKGQQFIAGWGGPQLVNGAFAFRGPTFNWFGSAQSGVGEDQLRGGVAYGDAWGAGLILALNRAHREPAATPVVQVDTTYEGQGYGVFGSFNLGFSDIYGQLTLHTGFDNLETGAHHSVSLDPGEDISYSRLGVLAGWKKDAFTEGDHALDLQFWLTRSSGDIPPPADLEQALLDVQLWLYHGYILLSRDGFAVFAGSNTSFHYASAEEVFAPDDDNSGMAFSITPNASFQKSLGKGFEVQAGIGATLAYLRGLKFGSTVDDESLLRTGATAFGIGSDVAGVATGADMTVGLRWQRENFAVEGQVQETLISNGPQFIGGGTPGLFGQIGMSVGF